MREHLSILGSIVTPQSQMYC